MKIRYLLLNCFRLSGSVRSVLNQAAAMAGAGHEVEIVSAVRDRDSMFFALPPRVRLTTLVDTRVADPLDAPGVLVPRAEGQYHLFTRRVEDAVVSYLRSAGDGVLVSTKPGLNMLVARYGSAPLVRVAQEHRHLAQRKSDLTDVIIRDYPRLDAVVTLTEADRREYAAALGQDAAAPGQDAATATHAPVLAAIPNALHRDPSGRRLSFRRRRPIVISAGRLSHQKGFDLLVRAFRPVAREHPRWRLRIYGRGRQEAKLHVRVLRYGLTDQVRLMGATERLDRRLAAASLFVLSSRSEGFPMVLLEAMACGLPVVAFDCPHGPAEIIQSPRQGLLVPPGDVRGLSAAISRLVADPPLRREMGAAARARAADFIPSQVVPMWERLFADLQARQVAGRDGAPTG